MLVIRNAHAVRMRMVEHDKSARAQDAARACSRRTTPASACSDASSIWPDRSSSSAAPSGSQATCAASSSASMPSARGAPFAAAGAASWAKKRCSQFCLYVKLMLGRSYVQVTSENGTLQAADKTGFPWFQRQGSRALRAPVGPPIAIQQQHA